jgi:hypothetical protein
MTRAREIPKRQLALFAGIVLLALVGRLAWDEYLIQQYAWRLPPALDREVSFARVIAFVLEEHCKPCHNPENTRCEYDRTSRPALIAGGETGAAVRVGNTRRSPLMHLIVTRDDE